MIMMMITLSDGDDDDDNDDDGDDDNVDDNYDADDGFKSCRFKCLVS